MRHTSKLAALALSLALVGAGGAGAAPAELVSTSPTPFLAPEGIEQGLWSLLPEDDRRAILGEPYPVMFPAPTPAAAEPGLAPTTQDELACWPYSWVLRAC